MNGTETTTGTENINTDTQNTVTSSQNNSQGSTQSSPQTNSQKQPAEQQNTPSDKQESKGLASQAGEAQKPAGAPENYDFKELLNDDELFDEDTANAFGEVCKGLDLSQEQANQVANFGFKYHDAIVQSIADSREKEIDSWATETKEKLGSKFNETMGNYGKALHYLEKTAPNIRQILNETGAGNRIEVVQAMALLGKLVSEDTGVGANAGGQNKGSNLYPNTDWNRYRR